MSNPAEIIVGGSGSTSISVDSTGGQSILVSPVGSTSVSVGSPESQSISITSSSTEVTVSSPDAQSVSVTNTPITVEVFTGNSPDIGIKRLRDLEDVIGDPTSGQILIYNEGENNFQFGEQQGASGAGRNDEELTDYAITVTNTDGAFSTIKDFTYEKFTSMTNILNDILNPYTKTSVELTGMDGTKNGSTFSLDTGAFRSVEVGSNIIFNTFSYSVPEPDKVKDGSIALTKDGSDYMSGLAESNTNNVALSPIISAQHNTPHTDTYRITATDNGNPNGQEYPLGSNIMTVKWRDRVGLAAYPTSPTDNASATDIYNNLVSSSLKDDPGSNPMDFTCSEENASDSNFSFLIWPSTFGILKSVLQNNSTDVTADFGLVGQYTVTNLNGVAITYYIYKTNDTGAFNDDVVLTVTLKDA